MAIRGDKALSPNSPRLPMDKLAEARRVRPVADRTGEKSPPPKEKFRTAGKRFHVLCNADLRMLEIDNMRTGFWFVALRTFVSAAVALATAAGVSRRSRINSKNRPGATIWEVC
jgi:hypothetical protein